MKHDSAKAVFLDRDGTLNIDKSYLSDPEQLELFPEVIPALQQCIQAGYRLFIVTNQSGIGRKMYTEEDMHQVNRRLVDRLLPHGIRFEKIYFAPEAPEENGPGRKPSPKFLLDAAEAYGLCLDQCFMIGDKRSDLECGWNAGVKASILVRTGYGAEVEPTLDKDRGDLMVADHLLEASAWILKQ